MGNSENSLIRDIVLHRTGRGFRLIFMAISIK